MANTTCQLECEDWVRLQWLPSQLGQQFHRERLRLTSGGVFDFDAVSADRRIAATISTAGANTSSGKRGAGKLSKLRADMLFLLMADVSRRLIILTESDMYDLCQREAQAGRVPTPIEFLHAPLPSELCRRRPAARRISSAEVSPLPNSYDEAALRERIRQTTPSNESLLKVAKTHQPPASWWNEESDPFSPDEGK